MTEPRGLPARGTLVLGATLALWLLALLALRFGFMEIRAEQDPCLRDPAGMSCRLRGLLGLSIHLGVFGIAAIVTALAAHLPLGAARRPLAVLALFAALLALVLYNPGYGAPAAVVAVIALADHGWFRRRGGAARSG